MPGERKSMTHRPSEQAGAAGGQRPGQRAARLRIGLGIVGAMILLVGFVASACSFVGPFDSVHSVAFSPDGKLLASGGSDGTVKLWDPQSGEELRTLSGHPNIANSVAFSPDGKLLASSSGG